MSKREKATCQANVRLSASERARWLALQNAYGITLRDLVLDGLARAERIANRLDPKGTAARARVALRERITLGGQTWERKT